MAASVYLYTGPEDEKEEDEKEDRDRKKILELAKPCLGDFKEFIKSFTKCIHITKLENHLIFASINFRQAHMERAIEVLVDSRYDEVVELIDKDEFIANPLDAYENKIFCKGAPLKTGVIWNKKYIEEEK